MTDAELNREVRPAPYDFLVGWLVPHFPEWLRPNHLTVARFVLSPLVFWLLGQGYYRSGFFIFLLAALTDLLDGAMARSRRQITVWGTLYDGVADKVLVGGVMLILLFQHLDGMVAGLVIILETLTLIIAAYFKTRKQVIQAANGWGKLKMNLQVAGIACVLIKVIWGFSSAGVVAWWLFVASLGAGLLSIFGHSFKFLSTRP